MQPRGRAPLPRRRPRPGPTALTDAGNPPQAGRGRGRAQGGKQISIAD